MASQIIYAVFMFLAVWWSLANFYKFCYKQTLPGFNMFLQAVGITGVIVMHVLGAI